MSAYFVRVPPSRVTVGVCSFCGSAPKYDRAYVAHLAAPEIAIDYTLDHQTSLPWQDWNAYLYMIEIETGTVGSVLRDTADSDVRAYSVSCWLRATLFSQYSTESERLSLARIYRVNIEQYLVASSVRGTTE